MNKIKLIDSNFDEQTGVSTATYETHIGRFTGMAILCPNDKEYPSHFAGCRVADLRARIKYYSALEKRLKSEAKGMKQICNSLENSIDATGKDDLKPALSIAKRNYFRKLNEVEYCKQMVTAIEERISATIDEREKFIKTKYGAKEIKE